MRRVFGVVLAFLLVFSVTAIAADKSLSDQQLAGITAGKNYDSEGASGALVANGSTKNDTQVYKIDLSGDAMAGVKGLTVANTSGGMLAVGINVFDGTVLDPKDSRYDKDSKWGVDYVKQSNSLSNYAPGPGSGVKLVDYQSSGSLYLDDPSLTISKKTFNLDVGYVKKSTDLDINASNSLKIRDKDFSAGFLAGGFEANRYELEGGLVGGYVSKDSFSLDKKSKFSLDYDSKFTKAWADLDVDKFYLKFTAEKISWRGPLSIGYAAAGDIVLDGSTEVTKEISVVQMSGSTMKDASGVYILNAANTLAGIGVNVGTIGSAATLKSFTQCNTVTNVIGKR